jgi:hypothetical protein
MFDKAEKEKKWKKRGKKIDGDGEEVGWGDQYREAGKIGGRRRGEVE